MKAYHENVINEILEIIKDNLILQYNYNEESLNNIRKYCTKRGHKRYKKLDNEILIFFVKEALSELINTSILYDLRDIE